MNIAEIKTNDIANGEGVRTSLFVSGCRHHCEDCFNYIAWDFNYGKKYNEEEKKNILDSMDNPWNDGLSLLGGEPFERENQKDLLELLKEFHTRFPNKNVWCYSGFTFEEITGKISSRAHTEYSVDMLKEIDILVDGKFDKNLKDISLKFRGSSNQRIIDVKKTFESGNIVIYLD